MAELKPCPFCGGIPHIEKHGFYNDRTKDFTDKTFGVICDNCHTSGWQFYTTNEKAIEAWNRRTKIETNIYDKEETYPNCTVQVLTNTVTGDVSVGWWENGGKEDGK